MEVAVPDPSSPSVLRHKQPTITLTLSDEDRQVLARMMSKGRSSARVFKRARVLQLLDEGQRPGTITVALGVSHTLIQRVGRRYLERGLSWALGEAPRPGVGRRLSEAQARDVLNLLNVAPPGSQKRWTVRLLARSAVELGIVDRVGRETIRELLHAHGAHPWKRSRRPPPAPEPSPTAPH